MEGNILSDVFQHLEHRSADADERKCREYQQLLVKQRTEVQHLLEQQQQLNEQQQRLNKQLQQLLRLPPEPKPEPEPTVVFPKEEPVLRVVNGWYTGWDIISKAREDAAIVGIDQFGHRAVHLPDHACVVVARDGLEVFQRLDLRFPKAIDNKTTTGYVLSDYDMCGDNAAGARMVVTEDHISPSMGSVGTDRYEDEPGEHLVMGCDESGKLIVRWGQMLWVKLPSGLKIPDFYREKCAHFGIGSGAELDGGAVFTRAGFLGIATRNDERSYWIWRVCGTEAPCVRIKVIKCKDKLAKAGFVAEKLEATACHESLLS
ncbi:uncharacterized protein LOC9649876 isoform X2 [Selaginella moellendorffii]|uniref:uncharacterized protein LOC9649876 isoform X2 n=1 Tax=Selaginella moellendorffii TaxID=88036 RepID=UPI000D1C4BE7|nr:uncharacterized protein LOC9649876 isoform X2 [Selaginella moellendorffii]|eukprot:XP_024515120.1 uncharacterized protein LOC9649876 isoform X2 [Selaginella moellendorffii]